VGKWIAKPNQLHHEQPLAFLNQGYWSRNWTTIVPSAVAFAMTSPNPWCLVFVFVSQANEIHAWAHSRGKVPLWILMFQETGFFQSPKHHAAHHVAPFATKYCVMSEWLNPFLDRMQLWRALEWFVEKVFRVKPHAA
jgi:ubiquitin-conjugating enzyme E2 variant